MVDDIAVKVSNITKTFKLPHEKQSSLKSTLINFGKRGFKKQVALKNVSFEVKKGEFFGIVGRNGSGKSTLLKLIAGIYVPDSGNITVNGKLVPFIELGVGFNPELSGRENVYLNGALLGFSRKEMAAMYDEIVEFAELEQFMDQKLKNYSSGMQVRLAFSIAIRANSDILILDEVLAVGDEAFQRKCNDYFTGMKNRQKTVILVTHAMDAVRRFCDRAILVKDGAIVMDGSPEDVANEYSLENLSPLSTTEREKQATESVIKDFEAKLLTPKQINQNDEVKIKVSYKTTKDIDTCVVCDLKDLDRNAPLVTAGSEPTRERTVSKIWSAKLSTINNTNVIANLVVRDKNGDILYFLPDNRSPRFAVRRSDYPNPKKPTTYAILFDKGKWE